MSKTPFVREAVPANAGALIYLRRRNERGRPLVEPPDAVEQPYLWLGSHPDIVEHVWDKLSARLPEGARCIVLGCPALSDPETGVILALALGTSYALRVPSNDHEEALAAGLRSTHTYSAPAKTLDAAETFGQDWLFGSFDGREPDWLRGGGLRARASQLRRLKSPSAR